MTERAAPHVVVGGNFNFADQWPGFTVACNKCGSQKISLENDMGFSPESGSWGSAILKCENCGNQIEIIIA